MIERLLLARILFFQHQVGFDLVLLVQLSQVLLAGLKGHLVLRLVGSRWVWKEQLSKHARCGVEPRKTVDNDIAIFAT